MPANEEAASVAASACRMRTDCLFGRHTCHGCLPLDWAGILSPEAVYLEVKGRVPSAEISPWRSPSGPWRFWSCGRVPPIRRLPGPVELPPCRTGATGAGEPPATPSRRKIPSERISSPSLAFFLMMISSLSVASGHLPETLAFLRLRISAHGGSPECLANPVPARALLGRNLGSRLPRHPGYSTSGCRLPLRRSCWIPCRNLGLPDSMASRTRIALVGDRVPRQRPEPQQNLACGT